MGGRISHHAKVRPLNVLVGRRPVGATNQRIGYSRYLFLVYSGLGTLFRPFRCVSKARAPARLAAAPTRWRSVLSAGACSPNPLTLILHARTELVRGQPLGNPVRLWGPRRRPHLSDRHHRRPEPPEEAVDVGRSRGFTGLLLACTCTAPRLEWHCGAANCDGLGEARNCAQRARPRAVFTFVFCTSWAEGF